MLQPLLGEGGRWGDESVFPRLAHAMTMEWCAARLHIDAAKCQVLLGGGPLVGAFCTMMGFHSA
jgi:hypothetical protein